VDAVRACFDLYTARDLGMIELAAQVNDLGYLYRDRYGVPRSFHTDDVRRMIDNVAFYAGHLPRRKAKDTPVSIMLDTHAPILPRELCERVAAVHQARHSRWGFGGGSPKHVYLLTNLYCGECETHLIGHFERGTRSYRHSDQRKKRCSQPKYIRADAVEGGVFGYLDCFQAPEEMKGRIREKARRLAKQAASPEWENARRRIAEGANKLERLKTLFVDGEIDKAEYQRRKTKIEEQQQEARQTLRAAPPDVKTLDDLLPKVDQIALVIREGDPAHQRVALTALFERVETLGGAVSKAIPREWARSFFNGESKPGK
jgi:hypothetical protein